jgi:predicted RNase H-like nuclease (RuvC/YqgF family)
MRDRRTLPSRQRPYRHLHVRVDRLEDAISHFYNVINELSRRVSTLEKKLEPLAKNVVAEAGPTGVKKTA